MKLVAYHGAGRDSRHAEKDIGRHVAPEILGVSISRPANPLWPADDFEQPVDKVTLGRYFKSVGPWVLPFVAGRPCSILKAPEGLGGSRFLQRHVVHAQCDRYAALAAIPQEGGLELHCRNGQPHRPGLPDRLVFELDPGPGVAFSFVVRAAWELKERLDRLNLTAFCKTNGAEGLHLVVPLDPQDEDLSWAEAAALAHAVCRRMAKAGAGRYTVGTAGQRRPGRILLNWEGNERYAVTLSLLSPRALAGVPVSMPLDWRDVTPDLDPQRYTVYSAPGLLLDRTPWATYSASRGSARDALWRLVGSTAYD